MKKNKLAHDQIYPLGIVIPMIWVCLQTLHPAGTVFAEQTELAPSVEPETYTIIKGDTLWDISEAKLKNPFLWPELWKANPYIVNPDLIYYDKKLVIRKPSASDVAPSGTGPSDAVPAEAGAAISESSLAAAEGTAGQVETGPPSEAAMEETADTETDTESEVSETSEQVLASAPPLSSTKGRWLEGLALPRLNGKPYDPRDLILSSGLIAHDVPSLGTVSHSSEGKTLFSNGDLITVRMDSGVAAKVGETYTLYRKLKRVEHPKTGKNLGNLIEVLGTLKVVQILQDRTISGKITSSYDYVFEGDHLAPHPFDQINVSQDANQRSSTAGLRGTLIEALHEKVLFGQYDVVYIDQGASQGVFQGDRFSVSRNKKGIGELVVISSRKDNATALVTFSDAPLEPGDDILSKE